MNDFKFKPGDRIILNEENTKNLLPEIKKALSNKVFVISVVNDKGNIFLVESVLEDPSPSKPWKSDIFKLIPSELGKLATKEVFEALSYSNI
jgi:hypothetical protein